jgi:DNA-directed RNA polymerase subunit RPC12/RpoP
MPKIRFKNYTVTRTFGEVETMQDEQLKRGKLMSRADFTALRMLGKFDQVLKENQIAIKEASKAEPEQPPIQKIVVTRFNLTCQQCGGNWETRLEKLPAECARCGSRRWAKPRLYRKRADAGKPRPHACKPTTPPGAS